MREVDPMIEVEFRQEILNTGLDHWNIHVIPKFQIY
jgi:hypothetical protein